MELESIAKARVIDDKWLAAFIVARCGENDAEINALTQLIMAASPRREHLASEVENARRRPVTSRRQLNDLTRELERLARLLAKGD